MILKAKHNIVIYPFFKWYIRWKIKRNFKPVEIISEIRAKELPVFVIANHITWWDGFWVEYVNQQLFKRKLHFMMLEQQLRRFWFFNYCGGFSVQKNSRSIIESLNYTCELLTHRDNLVFMFPQGKIHSIHQPVFTFEKGIGYILKQLKNPVQIVFMVALPDWFSNAKPGVWIYVEEFIPSDNSLNKIESSYTAFYNQCIEIHKNRAQ